jgi:AAHS family benzoate transporter-like MFS transporter
MRTINLDKIIGESKFNKFFLGVFLLGFCVLLFDGYDQGVYGASLPNLMKDTGIGAPMFGLIGSYTLYGMVAGGIIFGMLADKIGRKKAMMIGVSFYAVFTGLMGFGNTVTEFSIYRVLAGMGLAGVAPVTVAAVSEYSPLTKRPALVTICTAGVPVGTIFSALIGMVILPAFGWRPMFWIGFIPLLMVVIVYLYFPESMDTLLKNGEKNKIRKILKEANPEYVPAQDDQFVTDAPKLTKVPFISLFQKDLAANTILFWIMFGSAMYTFYGIITWLPKIMMQAGYPLGSSLRFMLTFSLGSIPGVLIAGPVAHKFGYKKAIVIYTLIPAILSLVLSNKISASFFLAILFVLGIGVYGAVGLIYAYVASIYTTAFRATGLGWGSAMGRAGGSLGPLIGGLLVAHNASVATNFVVFAFVPLVLCAIAVILTKDITKISKT